MQEGHCEALTEGTRGAAADANQTAADDAGGGQYLGVLVWHHSSGR